MENEPAFDEGNYRPCYFVDAQPYLLYIFGKDGGTKVIYFGTCADFGHGLLRPGPRGGSAFYIFWNHLGGRPRLKCSRPGATGIVQAWPSKISSHRNANTVRVCSSHVCSSSARPGERECHDATNRVAILGKAACKVQYRKAECLQMVNKKQKISGGAWTFCLPAVHLNTTGISKANSAKSEDGAGFNSQIFERRDDTLLKGRTIGGYAQFARSLGMRKSHELTRFTVHRQKPERQKQEDMR